MLLKKTNYQKGVRAEDRAAEYLIKQGYQILERRYNPKMGEIDLIAQRKDLLVFVEVKARKTKTEALESITLRSQKRIIQTAEYFLSLYDGVYDEARFDAVAVLPDQVYHLENAWRVE